MYITSLLLQNFRSWKDYSLDFGDITILIGKNGVGKTNILESVWMLASGRSWRTSSDADVIMWNADFSRISANITNSKDISIELFLSAARSRRDGQKNLVTSGSVSNIKNLKINGVKHRTIDMLGVMPAVLFSPESINMISGAPALRRKFLDILLSQINRKYALSLLEFQKVLRERNKLLENIKFKKSKEDELEYWDEKFVINGLAILKQRKDVIRFINKNIEKIHADISGKNEKMKIIYHESAPEENFAEHLVAVREREIAQGGTIAGPHRDDWRVVLGEKDLSTFGSRGEYRSAILAMKVLELRYIEAMGKKDKPILLLDDIFSELDFERRKHLSKIVSGQQTIITTTDIDHIEPELRSKAKIIKIENTFIDKP